jgi:hypothetical protein
MFSPLFVFTSANILHYYRKIKFIAITLEAISWTSLSRFISYQSILFNIILYFTIQYFKTNYVCRGLYIYSLDEY